jgi:hypothetical protein
MDKMTLQVLVPVRLARGICMKMWLSCTHSVWLYFLILMLLLSLALYTPKPCYIVCLSIITKPTENLV